MNRPLNKSCVKEKRRPEFKGKHENPKEEELKPYEIHFYEGIPYILIGYPGFEQEYAIDEKGLIDYPLTGYLRKRISENVNNSEKTDI